MNLGMIWAQARGGVIGHEGQMPWHLPEDLAHFRRTTGRDTVIMGRTSWYALPGTFRPLPHRRNIVLSRREDFFPQGAERATSLEEALAMVGEEPAWICGGAQLYDEAMTAASQLVVTDIDLDVPGDRFAPHIDSQWQLTDAEPPDGGWLEAAGGIRYRFATYRRR